MSTGLGGWLLRVVVGTIAFEVGLLCLRDDAVLWWSDVGITGAALAAAVCCARRGMRTDGPLRRTWLWTAAGVGSWAFGMLAWSAQQLTGAAAVPFPSVADVFFVAAVPLAAVAALSHLDGSLAARTKAVLDGLIGTASTVVAAAAVVLATAPDVLAGASLGGLIALSHPVGNAALAVWFTASALRRTGPDTRAIGFLAGVWAALGVLGFAYSVLVSRGEYHTGHWIDGGWVLVLGGLAAVASRPPAGEPRPSSKGRIALVLPYAPLPVALVAVVTGRVDGDVVLTAAAIVLGLLVVVRQYLTILENQALTRELEERVVARTAELATSEARYRRALAAAGIGSFEVDLEGTRVFWSLEMQAIHGIAPGTFGGTRRDAVGFCHPEDRSELQQAMQTMIDDGEADFQYRIVRPDGEVRWVEMRGSRRDGGRMVSGVVNDITERKAAEAKLDRLASTDALTGLPNRGRLLATLDAAFASSTPIALLMMDLDGFKEVNDGLGHDTGDLLLVEVASRLRANVRRDDLVARLGGDEFAIALVGPDAVAAAPRVADQLLAALRRPVEVAGLRLPIGSSVGIAFSPEHAATPADLLRHADIAMYRAKQRGSRWVVFDGATDERRTGRLALLADLRDAIDRGAIEVHYQPQLDLRTNRIIAVEALARWRDPVRGIVSPAEFIPLAEHAGVIRDLTPLVLREALAQCHRWRSEGFDLQVGVNLSARLLDDLALVGAIDGALRAAHVPPEALTLEITEGAFADDTPDVARNLNELRRLGVRLSVDDFGTGYSSLAYLRRFPVDDVKIDRTFIAGLPGHTETGIVRAVLELGRHLGVTVVAEGVEDETTLEVLRAWGCGVAQGYLIAHPQPAAGLTALLAASAGDTATPSRLR